MKEQDHNRSEKREPLLQLEQATRRVSGFELRVDLRVDRGDYFVVLGPSGSGKSMLLEVIAGLQPLTSGRIVMAGIDITRVPVSRRNIGLLFQDYALFPHLSVEENLTYSLRYGPEKSSRTERRRRVEEIAETFALTPLLSREIGALSGGEQQRLALARSVIQRPEILLLDEPLSALDVTLRDSFRALLYRLNREGQTIVHVTHDYEEAASLAGRMVVLQAGKIVQNGTPHEIFSNPSSGFVARFCGHHNFYTGSQLLTLFPAYPAVEEGRYLVDVAPSEDPGFSLSGMIEEIVPLAEGYLVSIRHADGLVFKQYTLSPSAIGEQMTMKVAEKSIVRCL